MKLLTICPNLDDWCSDLDWLAMPYDLSDTTKKELETLKEKLDIYGAYYNEGELKWKFLNPLITLVNYEEDIADYDVYIERSIKATVEGTPLIRSGGLYFGSR